MTLLLSASRAGHLEVATLLLERGADPNKARTDGMTALAFASWKGHLQTAQLPAVFGADFRAKFPDGRTALNLAIQYNVQARRRHPPGRRRLGAAQDRRVLLAPRGHQGRAQARPTVCPLTTLLAKAVHAGWSPAWHFMYPALGSGQHPHDAAGRCSCCDAALSGPAASVSVPAYILPACHLALAQGSPCVRSQCTGYSICF